MLKIIYPNSCFKSVVFNYIVTIFYYFCRVFSVFIPSVYKDWDDETVSGDKNMKLKRHVNRPVFNNMSLPPGVKIPPRGQSSTLR
jgi:hypothetical protein